MIHDRREDPHPRPVHRFGRRTFLTRAVAAGAGGGVVASFFMPLVKRSGRMSVSITDAPFGARGDGRDESSVIQAALNSGSSVVLIPSGTYVAQGLVVPSGVTLRGRGGTLRLADDAASDLLTMDPLSRGIHIESLDLDGNAAHQSRSTRCVVLAGRGCSIMRCSVRDAAFDAIVVANGTTACSVVGCRVTRARRFGVALEGTSVAPVVAARVERNIVSDTAASGLGVVGIAHGATFSSNLVHSTRGDGISGYNAANRHIRVVGNVIRSPANNGIHLGGSYLIISRNSVTEVDIGHGIALQANDNSRHCGFAVHDNHISGTRQRHGIHVYAYAHGTITANRVHACAGDGILLEGADDVTISDNGILSPGNCGIDVLTQFSTRMSVVSNRVVNSGNDGIRVRSDHALISDNFVRGTREGCGIFIASPQSQTSVRGIRVIGNRVTTTQAADGIEISSASDIIVSDNTITGSHLNGLELRITSSVSVARNTCRYSIRNGIALSQVDDATVSRNSVSSNGAAGISGSGLTSNVAIVENAVTDNRGLGIDTVDTSGEIWLRRNIVEGNAAGSVSPGPGTRLSQ